MTARRKIRLPDGDGIVLVEGPSDLAAFDDAALKSGRVVVVGAEGMPNLRRYSGTDMNLYISREHRLASLRVEVSGDQPMAEPGGWSSTLSRLLPGVQTEDWRDEARDHLACVAEDGGPLRQARRSLFLALLACLPAAWFRELRLRITRRA